MNDLRPDFAFDAIADMGKIFELDAIYRTAPIGLAVLTPDLHFVRVNEWLADINGLPPAAHIGRSVREIVPDLAPQAEATARKLLESGEPQLNIELIGETKTQPGVRKTWLESWTPIRSNDGRIVAINVVAKDVTEARSAEAARQRLLQLVERSDVIFALSDDNGQLFYLNAYGREKLGVGGADDLRRINFADYVAPGSKRLFLETAIPTAHSQGVWRGEMQLFNMKTDAVFDVHRTTFRLQDPDGSVSGFGTISRDITEEKRQAAKLKESEALFRGTFEQAAIGVAHVGLDGRWLLVNQRLCDMLGYSKPELLQKTFQEITSPDDLASDLDQVDRLLSGELETYSMEKRYIRADASLLWCRLTVSLIRDETGAPRHFVSVIEDITANKRADAALRESELFTRQITDIAPSILYIYDLLEKRNVWGNQWMVTSLGYSSEEISRMSGNLIQTLIHPDDFPAYLEHAAKLMTLADGELAEFDYRFRRADGAWIWLHSRDAVFRRDADGQPLQIIGAALDVSRRREAEAVLARDREELGRLVEARTAALLREVEERRVAEEALRQSEKLQLIGQMTGGIAHDFNNVLQVVASGIHLLKSGRLKEAQQASVLEGIERSARGAAEMVNRLLAIARRQKLHPEPIEIKPALESMAALLRRTLGSGIIVEVECADALPPVLADPGQFEMALLNLAMNARDAMPSGGKLTLRAREAEPAERRGRHVCVTVQDTGVGMPPAVVKRAFEPFFTTKEKGKGTGLGLPQVYGFANQSGGDVRIESEPGEGAAVTLCLPCPGETTPTASAMIEDGAAILQASGKVVLVVDDNPEIATFAAAMFESLGYKTLKAASAPEALTILDSGAHIDALFSDIVMPGAIGGADLAAIVRMRFPKVAVVLATGFSDQRQLLDESFNVLEKPYGLDDLRLAMERAQQSKG